MFWRSTLVYNNIIINNNNNNNNNWAFIGQAGRPSNDPEMPLHVRPTSRPPKPILFTSMAGLSKFMAAFRLSLETAVKVFLGWKFRRFA